jgi:hypothetical protein
MTTPRTCHSLVILPDPAHKNETQSILDTQQVLIVFSLYDTINELHKRMYKQLMALVEADDSLYVSEQVLDPR